MVLINSGNNNHNFFIFRGYRFSILFFVLPSRLQDIFNCYNCKYVASMARLQKTVSKVSLTKNTSKRRKNMRRVGKVIKSKTPTAL